MHHPIELEPAGLAPRGQSWHDMWLTYFKKPHNHRFEGHSVAEVAELSPEIEALVKQTQKYCALNGVTQEDCLKFLYCQLIPGIYHYYVPQNVENIG